MKQRFKDKIVVITGASAGIGRATAKAFAKQGASIALLARNQERLESTKQELERLGATVEYWQVDVSNFDRLRVIASEIEDTLGPIDIWINNAMLTVYSPIKQMKPAEYKRVTEVTYLGVVYGTLVALEKMWERNHGHIIQVGSALAYRGIPLQSAYSAAKHAIKGFHDSLCTELIHEKKHIHATMVQLPAHNTPQFDWAKSRMNKKAKPIAPIFQPEVAAKAILYAAHSKRREMFVGLPTVKAVLGNKMNPSIVDKYLAKTGYESQLSKELDNPMRPHNLYTAVEGDPGAHGRFDEEAKKHSMHLFATTHRWIFGIVAGVMGGLLIASYYKNKHDPEYINNTN